ncbi:MAG: hypothetical protein IPM57_11210 [Oligoflexia bacterium]|nr:hypothetical protein [Oligoflexia bacterium]
MAHLQLKILLIATFFVISACNQPTQVRTATTTADVSNKANIVGMYPHSDEFKKKTHGENFLQNATTCAKCHGADFNSGSAQVSCKACHVHPMGWAAPQKHGVHYLNSTEEQRADCLKCHQAEGASENLNCTNCHKAYPHKGRHGKLAKTYDGKCFSCHKQETHPQIPNNKMCNDCHQGSINIEWVEKPERIPNSKKKK